MNINIHSVTKIEKYTSKDSDSTWVDLIIYADGQKHRISLFVADVETRRDIESQLFNVSREA